MALRRKSKLRAEAHRQALWFEHARGKALHDRNAIERRRSRNKRAKVSRRKNRA